MVAITEFQGEYRFLSNFYPSPMTHYFSNPDNYFPADVVPIEFSTAEHFYQSMKTKDLQERKWVAASPTPGVAKRRGRQVEISPDWEADKYTVMSNAIEAKFRPGTELTQMLLDTGDAYLVEGNTWGDYTWGQVNGIGENWLGKILMARRTHLRHLNSLVL